jgi:hypothetical protein
MAKLFERKGDLIIADRRDPKAFDGLCELCGVKDELRPYGPGGMNVCFDCGMKDPDEVARQFKARLDSQ